MAEQIVQALTMTIIIGATFTETITWKDAAGTLVPLPLGTTAESKVRSSLYDDDVIVRFASSPGVNDGLIVLTNPGVTTLSLTAAQTAQLQAITGAVFDIKYTFPTVPPGVVVKLDQGQGLVEIREAVTR